MANGQQFDMYGRLIPAATVDPEALDAMISPVRCTRCGQVYDMAAVTVTARYADCLV